MARELPENGGPPKGTRNNFRTSVWSNLFTKEEVAFAEQHLWNDLSSEIEIIRIRLRRMLVAEARQMVTDGDMTTQELEEIVEEVYTTKTGKQVGNLLRKKKFRRADFHNQFDRLVARLESMTKLQHDLDRSAKGLNPDDTPPIGRIVVEVVGGKVESLNPVDDLEADDA
jgi:hypothetical protein